MAFLRVMLDGKWHQTKDLKVNTHISPRTLYKILKKFKPFIERKEDKTTYPPLVYYRINDFLRELKERTGEELDKESLTY